MNVIKMLFSCLEVRFWRGIGSWLAVYVSKLKNDMIELW